MHKAAINPLNTALNEKLLLSLSVCNLTSEEYVAELNIKP